MWLKRRDFSRQTQSFWEAQVYGACLLLSSVLVCIFENAVILPSPSYFNITNLQRDLTLPTKAKTWRLNSYHTILYHFHAGKK